MTAFVYRFRSTDALLGAHRELENQEIYFSPPQVLNDPMEGFKDVVWRGDQIVWANLVKHYLLRPTRTSTRSRYWRRRVISRRVRRVVRILHYGGPARDRT